MTLSDNRSATGRKSLQERLHRVPEVHLLPAGEERSSLLESVGRSARHARPEQTHMTHRAAILCAGHIPVRR